jgi:hypothetical protein
LLGVLRAVTDVTLGRGEGHVMAPLAGLDGDGQGVRGVGLAVTLTRKGKQLPAAVTDEVSSLRKAKMSRTSKDFAGVGKRKISR